MLSGNVPDPSEHFGQTVGFNIRVSHRLRYDAIGWKADTLSLHLPP